VISKLASRWGFFGFLTFTALGFELSLTLARQVLSHLRHTPLPSGLIRPWHWSTLEGVRGEPRLPGRGSHHWKARGRGPVEMKGRATKGRPQGPGWARADGVSWRAIAGLVSWPSLSHDTSLR
jgi:hypothetical protein